MPIEKPKQVFCVVLCKMRNGTVSRVKTHYWGRNTESWMPLVISPRKQRVMMAAVEIIPLDKDGRRFSKSNFIFE